MRLKKKKLNLLFHTSLYVLCSWAMASCSLIRGYQADGKRGPDIYSFERRIHDTIAHGTQTFQFPYAHQQATWIDTLHFFNTSRQSNPCTLFEALKDKTDTQGVLIIQNDSIVYEKCWGDITPNRLATAFSISKSITSLLCGIAVDEGYIKSIDDPVTNYLPELQKKNKQWKELKIRHLLNMQSGLDFDDVYALNLKKLKRLHAMAKLNYGRHIMKQIYGLKFRHTPGTEHRYESMGAEILGVVIERATGKHFADYLSEKVWKPLQMESSAWINIDSKKHHIPHTFGGISLTMKDLAKIGRLYLHRGLWNGKRIVSESWISQSVDDNPSNDGYHFNWYNLRSNDNEKSKYNGFYAHGIRGQVLYVNPQKQLIMVRMGKRDDTPIFIPHVFNDLSNCEQFSIGD